MEFELIRRYFEIPFGPLAKSNSQTVLAGIGDDCAVLQAENHGPLYISTDTLVEGVHFFGDDPALWVGWKSLASNLSDLAACGAAPLGFTLNISLPKVDENKPDENWLSGFSSGLLELAMRENCPLLGGDTTCAGDNPNKTISITVLGQAPAGHSGFPRSHAKIGDEIWVSGLPGLARLGLLLQYQRRDQLNSNCKQSELVGIQRILSILPCHLQEHALKALQQPVPRIQLGRQLHGLANACIDLSDGLAGDLGHLASSSALLASLSATAIECMWLEIWPELKQNPDSCALLNTLTKITLQGGDDFQLCWAASPVCHQKIRTLDASRDCSLYSSLHCIGTFEQGQGVWLTEATTKRTRLSGLSHHHFSEYKN